MVRAGAIRAEQPALHNPCRTIRVVQSGCPLACLLTFGDFVPLLPLFPLDVVLLPGTPLPLHIFEPRYKEMIAECRANGTPFGVVRARDEGIAEIGCTADIVTVTKEYSDGRPDLIAAGRQRFEVLDLNHERSFLRATVVVVPDEPGAASPDERARAIEVHREILSLAGAVQDISGADQDTLSFHIAGSLPLDLDFKQKLLGMRSESLRIPALAAYLESILPNLRRAARAREKAGGNGHAH
jgi:Lon protease-like protein